MTSDKTLRERIAEWRDGTHAEKLRDMGNSHGENSEFALVALNELLNCADELTPIAEALEAVVRDAHHQKELVIPAGGYYEETVTPDLGYQVCSVDCVRCRLERIVGKP